MKDLLRLLTQAVINASMHGALTRVRENCLIIQSEDLGAVRVYFEKDVISIIVEDDPQAIINAHKHLRLLE